jgi:hypothetical protein
MPTGYTGFRFGLLASFLAILCPIADAVGDVKAVRPRPEINALSLYSGPILFDVYRQGEKVGSHRVRFTRKGADLIISSRFDLQIDFLFFTAFRYVYESEERWRSGQLKALTVSVNDDGKIFSLEANRSGNSLTVKNGGDAYNVDAPLYLTNHWHAGVLGENRILNTLTGRVNKVTIQPIAREAVETERGEVMATRYAYSGELENEVWYDDAGRWVKMRFTGRDGSMIDYICRRCQGGVAREALR